MTRLPVDANLADVLPTLTEPVAFCDQTGRVLGHYYPRLDPTEYDLEPQITREEIDRRKQSGEPTYTTAEVLARLENL